MTSMQIALVQHSFALVEPVLDQAALTFYERLFQLDPSLRAMFHGPREDQARKLAHILTVVVNGLERPAQLRGAVEALGRRHGGYGVRDEHYATVGAALIATLEAGLGPAFTTEVRDAWVGAYTWLASVMQEAAAADAALVAATARSGMR